MVLQCLQLVSCNNAVSSGASVHVVVEVYIITTAFATRGCSHSHVAALFRTVGLKGREVC